MKGLVPLITRIKPYRNACVVCGECVFMRICGLYVVCECVCVCVRVTSGLVAAQLGECSVDLQILLHNNITTQHSNTQSQ
jgi:hypothetical protein